jgi:putative FmdB family regulatory protein
LLARGLGICSYISDKRIKKKRMPTYEYTCQKCNHQFEISQSINDNALTVCPKERCPQKPWGKGRVKRLIGAGAGLIFKGSGFYITDYRSKEYKEAAKKESAAPAATSGESKTAATPAKTDSSAATKKPAKE